MKTKSTEETLQLVLLPSLSAPTVKPGAKQVYILFLKIGRTQLQRR